MDESSSSKRLRTVEGKETPSSEVDRLVEEKKRKYGVWIKCDFDEFFKRAVASKALLEVVRNPTF